MDGLGVLDLSGGKDSYIVGAGCSNCGWRGQVTVAKGCPAPGKDMLGMSLATCPRCGNQAVRAHA